MKISIVIPTYEMKGYGTEYLKYNINSIINQTFTDFEVIITDHSIGNEIKELIESYNDARLVYIRNEDNRGITSANYNHGTKFTTGEIIKPIMQDDYFSDEDSLEIIHKDFLTGIKWAICGCHHTQDRKKSFHDLIPVWNGNILFLNTVGCPSCIAYLKNTNVQWDERLLNHMDLKYYYDMHKRHGLPYIDNRPLITIFCHANQLSYLIPDERKKWEMELMKRES